jgi:hypothetical protein
MPVTTTIGLPSLSRGAVMFPRPPYKHDPEEEETGFSEKIMLKQNDNAQVWFN